MGHGHGPSLLNDVENQSLVDFFSNTNPFHLAGPNPFPAALDTKDALYDYNNWGDFIAPATVHRVTTTIPDQAHLQHPFHHESAFASAQHTDHLGNTQDDLQAASTLFNNSQPSFPDGTVPSYHGPPRPDTDLSPAAGSSQTQSGRPMVATPHGLINEQLAALLPNHTEDGTFDAQLAAHWAANNASEHIQQHNQQNEAEHNPLFQTSDFKRSYTFGTDSSFNSPAGFAAPPTRGHEDANARPSRTGQDHADLIVRSIMGAPATDVGPTESTQAPPMRAENGSDKDKSEPESSGDESSERPRKKRKRSKLRAAKDSPRKVARNAKTRRTSLAEETNGRKRPSAAAQKLYRENLSEEQKRFNHILSEQKRRNLIKQGFDDLHDLVPEIRNGGLSKSSVLTEAGNFLEKLIQDNHAFWQVAGGAQGATLDQNDVS